MATCSQSELQAQACENQFTCVAQNPSLAEAIKLQLLCNISVNGSGGGSQTPWTSNIDAAGFNLNNLGLINGVRVYRALITQTGTDAPVATVLENSLGGVVVWTYSAVGTYFGTLAGAFTDLKTFSIISQRQPTFSEVGRNDGDSVFIQTAFIDFVAGTTPLADNVLSAASIEILVYP